MELGNLSQRTLPRYREIPNVGLYLKQVVSFINEATEPLLHTVVTSTMLSNYVKSHLVSSPAKKMYSRDQIAVLMFIVLAKNVLSLDNIRQALELQERVTQIDTAYDYFCAKVEAALKQMSGEDVEPFPTEDLSEEEHLLKCIVTALAQKIFLDEYFLKLQG